MRGFFASLRMTTIMIVRDMATKKKQATKKADAAVKVALVGFGTVGS